MIERITQGIEYIQTAHLSEKMKWEIIQALMIKHNSWVSKSFLKNYKKVIEIEEVIIWEQVNILSFDWWEFSPERYFSHEGRPLLASKIIVNWTKDTVEQKIIEMVIDRKPYNRNYFLAWPHEDGLRNCKLSFDRKYRNIDFVDEEYNWPPELYIDRIPFLKKNGFEKFCKGKSEEQIKQDLLNEKWFMDFIPDYKKT